MNEKRTIWLAGDSTMQTYDEERRSLCGWGEKLLELLEPGNPIQMYHREDSPFPTQMRYEGEKLIVDNCAMAGRSSKTFREEGRLEDIEKHIGEGDYFIIQFGHNDANVEKEERYVSIDDYRSSLGYYVECAKSHGAQPILVSSIILCPCEEQREGGALEIERLLPAYEDEMRRYAEECDIPFVNLHTLCKEWADGKSCEEMATLYRDDLIHLVDKGALQYASLVADKLKNILE